MQSVPSCFERRGFLSFGGKMFEALSRGSGGMVLNKNLGFIGALRLFAMQSERSYNCIFNFLGGL